MEQIRQQIEKFKKKREGFTLIELIVVIAIIGILAAVLLPQYFSFTDNAREKAVMAEAKNIRTIADTYYAEHGDWPKITIADSKTKLTDNATAFIGTISALKADGTKGTAVGTGEDLTTDGSFCYTKDKFTAYCDESGNMTASKD